MFKLAISERHKRCYLQARLVLGRTGQYCYQLFPSHFNYCAPRGARRTGQFATNYFQVISTIALREVLGRSGFADGCSKTNPDSEQIEPTGATLRKRYSASAEQIQDTGYSATNYLNTTLTAQLRKVLAEWDICHSGLRIFGRAPCERSEPSS